MKAIKAYLSNQRELASSMLREEWGKENPNLVLTNYWNSRIIIISNLISEHEKAHKATTQA